MAGAEMLAGPGNKLLEALLHRFGLLRDTDEAADVPLQHQDLTTWDGQVLAQPHYDRRLTDQGPTATADLTPTAPTPTAAHHAAPMQHAMHAPDAHQAPAVQGWGSSGSLQDPHQQLLPNHRPPPASPVQLVQQAQGQAQAQGQGQGQTRHCPGNSHQPAPPAMAAPGVAVCAAPAAHSIGGSSWGSFRSASSSCRPSQAGAGLGDLLAQEGAQAKPGSRSSGGGRRPLSVPPLNLRALPTEEQATAQPRASKQGSAGRFSWLQQPQSYTETLQDLEAELVSYTQPPRWQPKSEGTWYIHKPVTGQELRHYTALIDSLPCAQAVQVSKLLQALLQAQYSCELMATRGVRVAKDITAEWSRLTTGLLDRIDSYDQSMADMKRKMATQQQWCSCGRAVGGGSMGYRSPDQARRTAGGTPDLWQQQQQREREREREKEREDLRQQNVRLKETSVELANQLQRQRSKYEQAAQEMQRLQMEAQDMEAHMWQQHQILQQQQLASERQLPASSLLHQQQQQQLPASSLLASERQLPASSLEAAERQQQAHIQRLQAAAAERERQLQREVAVLKAALATQQKQVLARGGVNAADGVVGGGQGKGQGGSGAGEEHEGDVVASIAVPWGSYVKGGD